MTITIDSAFRASADEFITQWVLSRTKYSPLESTKHASDCYGFVHSFYKEVAGVELPTLKDEDMLSLLTLSKAYDRLLPSSLENGWEEVAEPQPYGIVVMGRNNRVYHVGIYHPDGVVYHVTRNEGVVGRPLRLIKMGLGYSYFAHYVYTGK
ncbi:UNVERIFIED_ORG: hypothetical protein GCAPEGMB_00441 [Vibrio phage V07]